MILKNSVSLLPTLTRTWLIIMLTALFSFQSASQSRKQVHNPYEGIDWANDQQHKANLSAHTMVSNGWMNPQSVVEAYQKLGYSVLAITDKGTITYPWEEFSKLKASPLTFSRVYHIVPKPFEENSIKLEETVFQDVGTSGMLAVQAIELPLENHDANSYFSVRRTAEAPAPKDGLTVLNHPGKYQFSLPWYKALFQKHDHLSGMEIFNRGNRDPFSRQLWDSILTVMASIRPVWGFSNDDFYSMRDLGRNWNVFPVPELNELQIRQAMEKGAFYFVYAPQGHSGPQPPSIESIEVNKKRGLIRIKTTGHERINWISEGKKVRRGSSFRINSLPEHNSYIRAEIYGKGNSVVCTQPFMIESPE